MDRQDLKARLRALEEAPIPEKKPGALCYAFGDPEPCSTFFRCRVCMNSSAYPEGLEVVAQANAIQQYMHTHPTWGFRVDDLDLCRDCRPNVDYPVIYAVFTINGVEERTAVSAEDVRFLAEFLNGGVEHFDVTDNTEPLATYTKRIKYLLGI